jgi:hypothetical protein
MITTRRLAASWGMGMGLGMLAILLAGLGPRGGGNPAAAQEAPAGKQTPTDPKPAAPPGRKFTLSPAPPPVPPLQYTLFIPASEQVRGNAALEYLRAIVLLPSPPRDPQEVQGRADKIDRWLSLPLEQLAPECDALQAHLRPYRPSLLALRHATGLATCDWQLEPFLQGDVTPLLEELGKYRQLGQLLRLQFRLHLARGQAEEAWRTLQAHLRLGRDLAESPTLIRALTGIAILASAWDSIEEWLSRPAAPNLSLALSQLPSLWPQPWPMLEGEAQFIGLARPQWKEVFQGVLPPETARRHLLAMYAILQRDPAGPPPFPEAQLLRLAAQQAPAARAELLQLGQPPQAVDEMPDAQALLLRNLLLLRQWWDSTVEAFRLPYHQAQARFAKLDQQVQQRIRRQDDVLLRVYALTLKSVWKTYHAFARTQRRIAALQTLEAIRWHAATHHGQLPERLADITVTPIPNDPYTGQPFLYRRTADGFILEAPPPAGEKPDSLNTLQYVIVWKTEGDKGK